MQACSRIGFHGEYHPNVNKSSLKFKDTRLFDA